MFLVEWRDVHVQHVQIGSICGLTGRDAQWKVGYMVSSWGERSGILDDIIYKWSEIMGADEPLRKSYKIKEGWMEEEHFRAGKNRPK